MLHAAAKLLSMHLCADQAGGRSVEGMNLLLQGPHHVAAAMHAGAGSVQHHDKDAGLTRSTQHCQPEDSPT